MITTRLMGRMGNQMFQIAAMVGYALRNNVAYLIPRTTLNISIWPSYFEHLALSVPPDLHSFNVINEQGHAYQELPKLEPGKNYIMNGYWQSYKYFEEYRGAIIKLFAFPHETIKDTVAIHIRRGDYLKYPTKHPVVGPEYIISALETLYFVSGKQQPTIIFFSDDPDWVKIFAKKRLVGIYDWDYEIMTNEDAYSSMVLMSCCEHNIICNSSFSWWGAWMNQNPNKIVIAPETWFGPDNAHLDTSTLLPEYFIKL